MCPNIFLHTSGFVLTHSLSQPLGLPVPDFLVVDLLCRFPFPLALARCGGGFGRPYADCDGLCATLGMLLLHCPQNFFLRVVPFDSAIFDLVSVGCEEVGSIS